MTVDQDSFCGGTTTVAWMKHLTGALQTCLGSCSDAECNGFGLIANMLPSVGFQYDPDNKGGIGTAQLILRWVEEQGNPEHRNYDHNGNRADGSTLASAYPLGIFYDPDKQKLIAGYMELGYQTQLKWKPRHSGDTGSARWVW